MTDYFFRPLQKDDYEGVAEIYNSNRTFLLNHLGKEKIDAAFIAEESAAMQAVGFLSCVIVDRAGKRICGVLDYRPGEEVYLSLFMLASGLQRKGLGHKIYLEFERQMRRNGSCSVRIDVVNDYPGHAVPFWKKPGFIEEEPISLSWHSKTSSAVVMKKRL